MSSDQTVEKKWNKTAESYVEAQGVDSAPSHESSARGPRLVFSAMTAAVFLVILLPLLSLVVSLPRTELEGVSMEARWPVWTLGGMKQGGVQRAVEKWAERSHPLWAWSVRLSNEMVYRLTGEVSLDYRTSVQGGSEGFLWQPMYLRAFNRSSAAPHQDIRNIYISYRRAHAFFKSKGIPLFAVINPNLLALYPELLPRKYQAIRANESSYEVARREIEQQQVSVINTFALLQSQKDRFPFRFFEPTGSHWNEVGSCLAVRAVGAELAKAWGEAIPDPACEQFAMQFPPQPAETDLIKIANLLNPSAYYRPAPYNTTTPRAVMKKKKKVLLIGTSFLFGLEKQLLSRGIADSTTLLFYFRQVRRDGEGSFHSFHPESLTNEELLSYDAIIVDANVASPGAMGYGFLPFVTKRWDLRKLPLPPITGER